MAVSRLVWSLMFSMTALWVGCGDKDSSDTGTDEGILYWIEYMLHGLNEEISKIDNLLEYDYVKKRILIGMIFR